MNGLKKRKTLSLCFCGLFCALFFVASNVIPAVQIVPGVPFTLQIFVIAFCAYLLGIKYSLLTYATICVLTLCGVPMMSGLSAGPAAFIKPSGGFIVGWIFVIIAAGIGRAVSKGIKNPIVTTAVTVIIGSVGVIFDYLFGAIWLSVSASSGIAGFYTSFVSSITAFFAFDVLKAALGYAAALFIEKILRIKKQ